MAKKGPLGKAEIFYVEEKYKIGKDIEEIANDLDRSNMSIQNHIGKAKITRNKTIIGEQFIHQRGSTIMTETASTMIDSVKNKHASIQSNCITKIKND